MWQLVVLCNKILIKVVGYQLYPNYTLNRKWLQVVQHLFQVYQNKIKEHKNWKFNAAKYRNIAVANRKSHNYAVNQLIKESGLEYTPEIFKLMSLVINEKFSIRKMSIVKVDIALFKLANNVSIWQLVTK